MSYNDEYNETENDYNSDSFVNAGEHGAFDNDIKESIPKVLNDLKMLSNRNDIKGIRNYINLHRKELNEYKTRINNNNVQVNDYTFVRTDGKLVIVKKFKPLDKALENSDNDAIKKETSYKLAADEQHKEVHKLKEKQLQLNLI